CADAPIATDAATAASITFTNFIFPPLCYITAPRYQGTNSSAPKPCRSLLLGSPEAVARINRKIFSPASCTVVDPSRISPALKSMSSSMRSYIGVLVAILSDGDGLHPYTEPRPVVKQIMFAPPATCPVAETGS